MRLSFPRLLLAVLALAAVAPAQIEISNPKYIPSIRTGTTYFATKDPTTERAKPFLESIRSTWKLSKIEVIPYADIEKHLAPGNSFLTLDGYVTTVQSFTMYSNGTTRHGVKNELSHIYLALWTCDPSQFKDGKPTAIADEMKVRLGRVELYTDFPTLADPRNIYGTEMDGDGHIRNWGPGFLKNQLQALSAELEKGEKRSLFEEENDKPTLARLRKDTLYVPDFALIKFSAFTGDESKRHDVKGLFEDYPYPYRVLPAAELDRKILTATEPFLYLVYVKSCTDKFVSVVDSKTGRLVYSEYSPTSYNLKSGDLEDLAEEIEGK